MEQTGVARICGNIRLVSGITGRIARRVAGVAATAIGPAPEHPLRTRWLHLAAQGQQ